MDHPTTVPENANMTEAPNKLNDAKGSRKALVDLNERDLTVLTNLLETAQPPGHKDVGTAGFRRSLSNELERQFYSDVEEGPFDEETTEEATQEESRDALQIMEDSKNLYERKNEDYGDSWKAIGEMLEAYFLHQGVEEIVIPVDANYFNSYGLFYRRFDKISRELNGWFLADEFEVSESITETHGDDVPYSAMHTQLAEEMAYGDAEEFLP